MTILKYLQGFVGATPLNRVGGQAEKNDGKCSINPNRINANSPKEKKCGGE